MKYILLSLFILFLTFCTGNREDAGIYISTNNGSITATIDNQEYTQLDTLSGSSQATLLKNAGVLAVDVPQDDVKAVPLLAILYMNGIVEALDSIDVSALTEFTFNDLYDGEYSIVIVSGTDMISERNNIPVSQEHVTTVTIQVNLSIYYITNKSVTNVDNSVTNVYYGFPSSASLSSEVLTVSSASEQSSQLANLVVSSNDKLESSSSNNNVSSAVIQLPSSVVSSSTIVPVSSSSTVTTSSVSSAPLSSSNSVSSSSATNPISSSTITEFTVTLQPGPSEGKDALIYYSPHPSSNTHLVSINEGVKELMAAGRFDAGTSFRSMISFNTATIPTNATITSATFVLSVSHWYDKHVIEDYRIDIHKMLKSWKEGTGDKVEATALTDGVTGLERFWGSQDGTEDWNETFVGLDDVDASIQIFGSVTRSYSDLTPWNFDMTSLVQEWVSAPEVNFGVLMRNPSDKISSATLPAIPHFYTSERGVLEDRPKLVVTYTINE